jgi:hypothetical protein
MNLDVVRVLALATDTISLRCTLIASETTA